MNIYNTKNSGFSLLKEVPFKLEREIQRLFEANLFALMGLELVKSEFTIKGKRIDTLAYDPQSCAFIIIEYKRDKSNSVVDQGFSYLGLMLENKADFVLSYNETLSKSLHSSSIDWSQTRVAFVSTSFTENQRLAANFKDLAIELWEIKRYENDLISIQEIKKTKSAESIKPITQLNSETKFITDEIKIYSEDDHLNNKSDLTVALYNSFKEALLTLNPDFNIDPKKKYIAYKLDKNIVDIKVQARSLKIYINLKKGKLNDSKGIMRDVSSTGHHGNGDYQITVSDTENLEYIMSLVKQAF